MGAHHETFRHAGATVGRCDGTGVQCVRRFGVDRCGELLEARAFGQPIVDDRLAGPGDVQQQVARAFALGGHAPQQIGRVERRRQLQTSLPTFRDALEATVHADLERERQVLVVRMLRAGFPHQAAEAAGEVTAQRLQALVVVAREVAAFTRIPATRRATLDRDVSATIGAELHGHVVDQHVLLGGGERNARRRHAR